MIVVILLVLGIFSAVVLIHELGHFMMARRNGIAVEEFGVGFPPRLVSRKFGKTLYSINLLPLGGFVRMKGEESSAGAKDSFGAANFRAKTKVMLAGVAMNLILAYVILLALCLTGLPPTLEGQDSVGHPTYSQPRQLVVSEVSKGSPAEQGGVRAGDFVISANGQDLTREQELFDFTKQNAGQTVALKVERGAETTIREIKLRGPDSKEGFLGVSTFQTYKLRYQPSEAVWVAGKLTVQIVWATIVGVVALLVRLPVLFIGLFGGGVPKAAEAASGPLGIFFIIKNISIFGASYIFLFMANISIALASFNVMPIPALDGGRLAVEAYQKVTGRPLSQRISGRIYTAGFVFLMALLITFTVYDLRKLHR